MPLDLQYDVINDTPASASPVEANYNRIEQYINQEVITRDGVTAMTAQLRLIGNPVSDLDAAPKSYVDAMLPIGIIMLFGGLAAPGGGRWALANGAELETAAYPEAYAILGTRFVAGTPAAGRFNLPNLSDRVPVGAGASTAVGATGGNRDAVVPTHSHVMDHAHAGTTSGDDSPDHAHEGIDHLHGVNINSGDSNAYHNHAISQGVARRCGGSQERALSGYSPVTALSRSTTLVSTPMEPPTSTTSTAIRARPIVR